MNLNVYRYWDNVRKDPDHYKKLNPKIPINQVLSNDFQDIMNPQHREVIYNFSPFMARHTNDIAASVFEGIETTIKSDKLLIQECFSLGLVVDTAAIITLKNKKEQPVRYVISRNLMDDIQWIDRHISSFKFTFRNEDGSKPENKQQTFYSQFSGKAEPTAIIFTPKPSATSEFGEVVLMREIQTALELIRITYMSIIFLKNGGNMPVIMGIPKELDPDSRQNITDQFYDGLEGSIQLMEIPEEMYSQNDQYDINKLIIKWGDSKLKMEDFNVIHKHLLEDSPLPQMEIAGQAETGALGGEAPVVDQQEARDTYSDFRIYAQQLIEDFKLFGLGVFKSDDLRKKETIIDERGATEKDSRTSEPTDKAV